MFIINGITNYTCYFIFKLYYYSLIRFGYAHRVSAKKHSRDFAIRRAAKKLKEEKTVEVKATIIAPKKRIKNSLNHCLEVKKKTKKIALANTDT